MWLFRSGFLLLVYFGVNVYSGIRLLWFLKYFLPSIKAVFFWPFYAFFCFFYILIYLLRLDRVYPLRLAAMYSLPFFLYLFFALFLFDVLRVILRFVKSIYLSPKLRAAGSGIALLSVFCVIFFGAINARQINAVQYSLTLSKGDSSPLRVALITDLHIGGTVGTRWVAKIVDAANSTNPDLICIAGDIFDSGLSGVRDPDAVSAELRRLNAPLGVYACPGNHDGDRQTIAGQEWRAFDGMYTFLEKSGIMLLLDREEFIDGRFYLIGRLDARLRQARKGAPELLEGIDRSKPVIILDHQPVDFPSEEKAGVDLIFSGHTHRGQVFPANIVTADMYKKAGAVHYGYWRGETAQAVVSSGAGVWGTPIRVATGSEVVVVDLEFADKIKDNQNAE